LVHIELQSANDTAMIWRMAEYAFLINRQYHRWPTQFVLYVGQPLLRMPSRLAGGSLTFECCMVDMRQFDAEPWLSSPHLEDNILAVLAKLTHESDAVKRILRHIARCDQARRSRAMQELTILAGLRKLGNVIRQEACKMPILDDLSDHDLFGPAIIQSRQDGERLVISRLITRRFGSVPVWAKERLDSLTSPELEKVELRLLEAQSLEELFA
jgi:hypothetical protein